MQGLGGRSLTDQDTPEVTTTPRRWRRRSVIAGLAGTAVGATAFTAARVLDDDGPPAATDVRRTADTPADAGGFANPGESYAPIGPPTPISATQGAPPPPLYPPPPPAA